MWAALQTYLTQLAQVYSIIMGKLADAMITRFFGIFFFFWQTCDLWGNLLSSLILTNVISDDDKPNFDVCGSDFCVASLEDIGERPDDSEVYTLVAVYSVLLVTVLLIVGFLLDPLTRYGEKRDDASSSGFIFATLRQMRKPNQMLLILATIFIGMQQAFMAADYSAAFVSCALNINYIGYVLLTYG